MTNRVQIRQCSRRPHAALAAALWLGLLLAACGAPANRAESGATSAATVDVTATAASRIIAAALAPAAATATPDAVPTASATASPDAAPVGHGPCADFDRPAHAQPDAYADTRRHRNGGIA